MRRLVAALVVALMLVMLTGCGGGGDEASSGEVTAQTQAPPPSSGAAATEDDTGDMTALEEQVYEPFPTDAEVITAEITERLDVGQPMIVYFYDSAQKTSENQRAEIDLVFEDYRGLIELIAYDAGTYVDISESGKITVSPDLLDDETANSIARLMSEDYLGITFTPYLVFVDSNGYITYRYRGFVDSELIERQVLRATE